MRLRVWWTPAIPGPQFHVSVSSAVEGAKVIRTLAEYDLFLAEHKMMGDTANTGGLEMFDSEDTSDGPDGSWVAWVDEKTGLEDPLQLFEVTNLDCCHIEDAALLAVVKDGDDVESVTVFVPYDKHSRDPWSCASYFGNVDIVFSFRASYLMISREQSGFNTGLAIEGESFTVLPKAEALSRAREIMLEAKASDAR